MNRAGIIYLTLTLTAALGVLVATLWLYIAYGRGAPETFSAAVVNTAATLAAATFVGVFDMFFTIQQLRKNEEDRKQWEEDRKQWQAELEQARKEADARREEQRAEAEEERAEAQKQRSEADARLERLLEDFRNEREQAQAQQEQSQQVIANLLAQNMELNARLIELLERRNGNGAAG